MEIRTLYTFVKAAELQSFTKAALCLGYAQSTVTAQIRQLEEELQVSLFERIGKRIKITQAGQELLPYAQQILHLSEEVRTLGAASDCISGTLRIGVVESLQNCVLPPILHAFCESCPLVKLSIKASDCQTLSSLLAQNEIDFMFVFDTRIRTPDFITIWEKKEPMYFIASPSHPLSHEKSLTPMDLLRAPFLETESNLSYGRELHSYLARQGVSLNPKLQIGNPQVIVRLVEKGSGISFLPAYTLKESLEKGTVRILPLFPEISMWMQILCHKNKWMTKAMETFFSTASAILTTTSSRESEIIPRN